MNFLEHEFEAASKFLEPLLKPSKPSSKTDEISVTKLLRPRCEIFRENDDFPDQVVVALQALRLLELIDAKLKDANTTAQEVDEVFHTPRRRRVLNALVDIVSIEGIHPYLQTGVGLPITQRLQSTFSNWELSARQSVSTTSWEKGALQVYRKISCLRTGSLLSHLIDDRILVDLLAFMLQAAYSPIIQNESIKDAIPHVVGSLETIKLMPLVASLLHAGAPDWLVSAASSILAGAPMRLNGIRDTINFIANSQQRRGEASKLEHSTHSSGPVISNDVLEQAAQVICAVPKSIEPDIWFRAIGSQLLAMLSGSNADEWKSASYIGGAILSRRNVGSPGKAGWRWLTVPLLGNLNPEQTGELESVWHTIQDTINVKDPIGWAVSCLAKLLLLNPNPGLVRRLGSRAVNSLWYVACSARTGSSMQQTREEAVKILQRFTKDSGPDVIEKLLDRLLFDGTSKWQYRASDGRIEVVPREQTFEDDLSGHPMIAKLESNMSTLIEVTDGLPDEDVCSTFVRVLNMWASIETSSNRSGLLQPGAEDPKKHLVLTRAVHALLGKYESVVASKPAKLLPVIISLLERYTTDKQMSEKQKASVGISNLVNIKGDHDVSDTDEEDPAALASFGLGLLTIILIERKNVVDAPEALESFDSLRKILTRLVELPRLPQSLLLSAQTILMQVSFTPDDMSISSKGKAARLNTHKDDQVIYQQALANMSSQLPPIRAEGLNSLNALINCSSPAVLTSSTMSVLLALLQEDDEYTYLNAIKSISLLVGRQPSSASVLLVDAYSDPYEASTLEVRLRLGEAIERVVRDLGPDISPAASSKIARSMVIIAGRRGQREKELENRRKDIKQKKRERRRAESEWGGEVPELPEDFREEVTPADEVAARLMEKWAGSGKEEDMRIRASALSVLGALLSQAVTQLQEVTAEDITDLCVSILQHEKDEGAAILRRAAILVLQGFFIGSNEAQLQIRISSPLLDERRVATILENLNHVRDSDDDTIVRGHADEVLKMVESIQANALEVKLRGEDIRTDLGGKLRGLAVQANTSQRLKPVIQEIE